MSPMRRAYRRGTEWMLAHRVTLCFLALVLLFGSISYQQMRANLATNRESYARCIDRQHNIDRSRAGWKLLIWIEEHNHVADPSTVQGRLKAYRLLMPDEPNCGPKP